MKRINKTLLTLIVISSITTQSFAQSNIGPNPNFIVGTTSGTTKYWITGNGTSLGIGGIGSTSPATGLINITGGFIGIGGQPVLGKPIAIIGTSIRNTNAGSYIDINNTATLASFAFQTVSPTTIANLGWNGTAMNISTTATTALPFTFSNMNVGIGTTTTTGKLSLYDVTAVGLNLQSSTGSKFWMSANSTNMFIGAVNTNSTPTSGPITIDAGGLVGVGGLPITGKSLSINGATASSVAFKTASATIATMGWNGSSMSVSSTVVATPFTFSNMNVGIGTTTVPTNALEVNGTIKATTVIDATGISIASKWTKNSDKSITSSFPVSINSIAKENYQLSVGGLAGPYSTSNGQQGIYVSSFGGNSFFAQTFAGNAVYSKAEGYNGTPGYSGYFEGGNFLISRLNQSANPDLFVNNDGNVSIGTKTIYATPGVPTDIFKLSVNGKIACKELNVDVHWADFVFEPNYKLRKLHDVETYINDNKHLPDIPSADDVEKKGIGVGDMQSKMMQKIEELTLYIITQDKNIQKQQATIELMQAEINALKRCE
jgi:hypothetical protein